MASDEHHNLAYFIKSVHQELRCQSRKVGPDEAWRSHCEQSDTLEKYASAMKLLATKYWDPNAEDVTKQAQSRIRWVVDHSLKYFMGGFKLERRIKEENKWSKLLSKSIEPADISFVLDTDICRAATPVLRLLDVGSCYNPFKKFDFFEVLPIDIAPASTDVHKCDFLNLNVRPRTSAHQDCSETWASGILTELQECTFDVVVFSLLLEYLPSSQQRYSACVKAYELLKPEGLLFIITPDSKNPSTNAPLMKKWRIALADIGYIRIFYEKLPHLHCMAFRKTLHVILSKHLGDCLAGGNQSTSPAELIAIPQDFNVSEDKEDSSSVFVDRTEQENQSVTCLFDELPS